MANRYGKWILLSTWCRKWQPMETRRDVQRDRHNAMVYYYYYNITVTPHAEKVSMFT